jgi:hypothetical protein
MAIYIYITAEFIPVKITPSPKLRYLAKENLSFGRGGVGWDG